MRIVKLTPESRADILNSLLKRSPNHYTEYESAVKEILEPGVEPGTTHMRSMCSTSELHPQP